MKLPVESGSGGTGQANCLPPHAGTQMSRQFTNDKPKWFLDWSDKCAAIIGAGPSLKKETVERLRDRLKVIVINESYRMAMWADVLYACEGPWWDQQKAETIKFKGLKVGYEPPMMLVHKQPVERIEIKRKPNWRHEKDWYVHEFVFDKAGEIGSGQNSGFQAINLAAQFGAKRIALLGFDMQGAPNIHWHGPHKSPLRNPDYDRFEKWREHLTKAAPTLVDRGIDVVNCSAQTSLNCFPKISVDEMLERWKL